MLQTHHTIFLATLAYMIKRKDERIYQNSLIKRYLHLVGKNTTTVSLSALVHPLSEYTYFEIQRLGTKKRPFLRGVVLKKSLHLIKSTREHYQVRFL